VLLKTKQLKILLKYHNDKKSALLFALKNLRDAKFTIFASQFQTMTKAFSVLLLSLIIAVNIHAHEFHVGICRVDYEEAEKMMFCTIQLESGDFEHWTEDQNQLFNINELARNQRKSESWRTFETFVLKYFGAKTNTATVQFELFEMEIEADGRMFIYLVAHDVQPFKEITWHFSLLMGHSMEQQNKIEFKYINAEKANTYFAYFFENETYKTTQMQP
jgi:hypothetical protein